MNEAEQPTPNAASQDAPSQAALALQQAPSDAALALRQTLVRNWHELEATPGAMTDFERPPLYKSRYGSMTLGTKAQKLGAGYDVLAPHSRVCPYHYHLAQEEMFVILEGQGHLRVAGELVPIKAGDVITIPPGVEHPHHILNTSDAPMRYLSISTLEKPEVCYYPDSDKLGAYAPDHRMLVQRGTNVDYWVGEDEDKALIKKG